MKLNINTRKLFIVGIASIRVAVMLVNSEEKTRK